MLLKTKLFSYLLFCLIVSAKHIEKTWLHLSVVWEHFTILKRFAGGEIPFHPAVPSACYCNAQFLAYFTFLLLIFVLISELLWTGSYLPLQLLSTLYVYSITLTQVINDNGFENVYMYLSPKAI